MRKLGYPLAPMVLASVLAQMLETSLKQSLVLSGSSPLIFFTRPISASFIGLAFIMIAWGLWLNFRGRGAELAADDGEA